jgi:YfiH family protein
MAFHVSNGLRFYSFEIFDGEPVWQGVFTRHGGVSPSPWNSLNTGGLSGDSRENVIENRRRIFSVFDRPVESIFDVWQVHSADVIIADGPRPLDQPHEKADAIATDRADVTLFMRFGDCVPILLYDPMKRVVAQAHAGWMGTVGNVVGETVKQMQRRFGCRPVDLLAGIGPSICPDHYEVGSDVIARVQGVFGVESGAVVIERDGKTLFDLWQANALLLKRAGLHSDHIQVSGICTAGNIEDWYSHRGENGKTGRFGALLALK